MKNKKEILAVLRELREIGVAHVKFDPEDSITEVAFLEVSPGDVQKGLDKVQQDETKKVMDSLSDDPDLKSRFEKAMKDRDLYWSA